MKRMNLSHIEEVEEVIALAFVAATVVFDDWIWDLASKLSLIAAVIVDCL